MLKDLVTYVVQKLVDAPDQVTVTEEVEDKTVVIKVQVAPEDLGKVIGKEGRTARSIRLIVYAAAMKEGKRAILEIVK